MTLYSASGQAQFDRQLVQDFTAGPGIVDEGDAVATFRWLGTEKIRQEHLDLNLIFEVDVAGVTESIGPGSPQPRRPWGSLDRRLQAIHLAVVDYTEGLVEIAEGRRIND